MIAVFGIRIYIVMTIRVWKFSRKKLKTAAEIWIWNLVSIFWWKCGILWQLILVRYRIGSDRTLPIAFHLFIGLWYLMFFIVSITRRMVGDFWLMIFDQKSKKHYSILPHSMIVCGMTCSVVSIYMKFYMCVIDFTVMCDHREASTSIQWTSVSF